MRFTTAFQIVFLSLVVVSVACAQPLLDQQYFNSLKYSHDLKLPDWGPYTKKYIGVSHIPKVEEGIRFDLSVFPGFYRRKVDVPNVFFESGFHPWEASPNLDYFSFRHELEWKDRVYTDVSYSKINENARLVRMECVNNTEYDQSIVMHMMSSIHFPSIREYNPNTPLKHSEIKLPNNAIWVDGLDYTEIKYAEPDPRDQLVYDGKLRGEIRDHGLVNGSGLGKNFGGQAGDNVSYSGRVGQSVKNPVLWFRYKVDKEKQAELEFSGLVNKVIVFPGNGGFQEISIPLQEVTTGDYHLTIISKANIPIVIDGYVIVAEEDMTDIEVSTVDWNYVPEILKGPLENSIILKYENTDQYYGIAWDYEDFEIRKWNYKDLSDDFRQKVNSHSDTEFSNGTNGHFTNIFLRPINIKANSTKVIDAMVCTGNKKQVENFLKNETQGMNVESIYQNARKNLYQYDAVPAGEKYLFSNRRMAATTITNVVYPVYTQRQYIRHHAPGRWWDCLYTWDAGFIGIGLAQQNIQRGVESLNAYLNETDEQSAFIHHGTPLPVQHYLFQELWNKTQSDEMLANYYPKLKRYYEFLSGKNGSSSTRMKSNLIRTWDYFYNSGGWDDYPPQHHLRQHPSMYKNVTPVVSTSHAIRIAKILEMAADHLKLKQDVKSYAVDISRMSESLQKNSWDAESGYFGYVVHDENGETTDILKYNDKVNFNMGLDGASPLVSGICTEEQKEQLLKHLKTKGEIWSDVGLSAVDQSAPYYSNEGYWNGTVWMPHQWFFWKTMLDLGEADFAFKIADTALNLWKREVESTYNCSEHFVIETGRGAGWHQFSGLSTPVLSWFNAYYQQGILTTGFNAWIQQKNFSDSNDSLEAKLKVFADKNDSFSVVACLNPDFSYDVYWNDKKVEYKELNKGTLSITVKGKATAGILRVEKKG
ncbi:MAG: hypothetical protein JXQ96_17285 [Cyclobacteriaceae bacterium]